MQFLYDGAFHKVVRITGPTHNILGLQFANECIDPIHRPTVVQLQTFTHARLDTERVVRAVEAGVREANQKLGVSFRLVAFQFLPDDSPPEETYRELTMCVIERIAQNLPFTDVRPKST
jgi:hypothetical protein